MTYTTPRTWVAGEVVTAAIMNLHLRDELNYLANPPRATAYVNVAQNHPTTAIFSTVALDAEIIDTDNMHNNASVTSRLTAQTAGKYEVGGQITFASNVTGRRAARLIVNNTGGGNLGQTEVALGASTTAVVIPTIEITLGVGDYVEMQGFQTSGGALAYGVGTQLTFLRAKWIGV